MDSTGKYIENHKCGESLDLKNVIEIANQFRIQGRVVHIREYGNGNINKTFLITTDGKEHKNFILQRLNTNVFLKPESVMQNMCIVSEHICRRIQSSDAASIQNWQVPRIIRTHAEQDYWIAPDKTFWRIISFIENSRCLEAVADSEAATELGCALGTFHNLVSDLPAEQLADTLEGFHITPHYIRRYEQVLRTGKIGASPEVNHCMRFVAERRSSANVLEEAKAQGKLPLRIIHGDPKVNNVMMEEGTGKAISIIDLDTVKPGLIHYDVGDCLRSGCNRSGEEAGATWESVYFDTDTCRSILQGYISQARKFLTENDYEYLYDAIRLIAFELGLRFFTDYLEGNVYFQNIEHPEQNLLRALVQFKLTESIESSEAEIKRIIRDIK